MLLFFFRWTLGAAGGAVDPHPGGERAAGCDRKAHGLIPSKGIVVVLVHGDDRDVFQRLRIGVQVLRLRNGCGSDGRWDNSGPWRRRKRRIWVPSGREVAGLWFRQWGVNVVLRVQDPNVPESIPEDVHPFVHLFPGARAQPEAAGLSRDDELERVTLDDDGGGDMGALGQRSGPDGLVGRAGLWIRVELQKRLQIKGKQGQFIGLRVEHLMNVDYLDVIVYAELHPEPFVLLAKGPRDAAPSSRCPPEPAGLVDLPDGEW